METLSSRACCHRTRGDGFKLKESWFRINIRKTFLQCRWWNTGRGFPERWWMPHPWKHSSQAHSRMGLWATTSSWRCPSSMQGDWIRWHLNVPSTPNYSMICNNDDSFFNLYTDFMALCAFNLYSRLQQRTVR